MSNFRSYRAYLTIDVELARQVCPDVLECYDCGNFTGLVRALDERVGAVADESRCNPHFASHHFSAGDVAIGKVDVGKSKRLIVAFASPDEHTYRQFDETFRGRSDGVCAIGADLPFESVDHWCPQAPTGHKFAGRDFANRLIELDALRQANLLGRDVNVVIVDRGLNADDITDKLKGRYGGGWNVRHKDGQVVEHGRLEVVRGVSNNEHGMMVARNVLAVAPEATLWDLPLLPGRIVDLPMFLSDAHAALEHVAAKVQAAGGRQRWVIVNAWAVFSRESEFPPGDYSENLAHAFNQLIGDLANCGADVVFAAGNCGQFRPDARCRKYDIGAGRSIFGANAHPRVLTVGAVTANGTWHGSSAQGPGPGDPETPDPHRLSGRKPDLAAPSAFTEEHDRHTLNSGTSAACAIAAGVVATLRERWGPDSVSPDRMIEVLRQSAHRPGARRWDSRVGWGIVNARMALAQIGDATVQLEEAVPS